MRETRPLGGLALSLGRIACRRGRSLGRRLEPRDRLVAAIGRGALRLGEIVAQSLLEPGRRLAPERQALARALQPVESAKRGLRPAGGVGQLVLGLLPLLEQRRSFSCALAARNRDGVATRLGVGAAVPTASRSSCAMRALNAAISTASFSARSAAVAWRASGRSRLRTSSSTSFARSTWVATRASLSSARCLRRLNLPSPAASSTRWRRSSGFEASTASTLP